MKAYKTSISHWSHDWLESSNGVTVNQKKTSIYTNSKILEKQLFAIIIKNFCRIELATYTTKNVNYFWINNMLEIIKCFYCFFASIMLIAMP